MLTKAADKQVAIEGRELDDVLASFKCILSTEEAECLRARRNVAG